MFGEGTWSSREYKLDKMTLRELAAGYFTYPGIQVYFALSAICVTIAIALSDGLMRLLIGAIATGLVYPLVWYLLHRFVLHGTWLYKRRTWNSTIRRVDCVRSE